MNDKPFDFRKIYQGMMSYLYLKLSWSFLGPLPILILFAPLWMPLLPSIGIGIHVGSFSMQWLIGLAVISVAIGFFLRWLAFGILADNRLRIGVCVAYTAVLGILHFLLSTGEILVSYNSVDFRPGNAMKDGLSAVFEFLTLIGFLWLLLSKKKN